MKEEEVLSRELTSVVTSPRLKTLAKFGLKFAIAHIYTKMI